MAGGGAATAIKYHTEDKPQEIDITEVIRIADFDSGDTSFSRIAFTTKRYSRQVKHNLASMSRAVTTTEDKALGL